MRLNFLKFLGALLFSIGFFPDVTHAVDYQEIWGAPTASIGILNAPSDIKISSSGQHQVITSAWRTGGTVTYGVLCSNPGPKTITTAGSIFSSQDYGKTWRESSLGDFSPTSVAISGDSKYQSIIGSTYSGKYTWAFRRSVGGNCQANGGGDGYVVALGSPEVLKNSQYLKTSSDYGATWTTYTLPANSSPREIAMSTDGKYQSYILGSGYNTTGSLYVSSDYGKTWSKRSVNADWNNLAVSNTGKYQTAVAVNSSAPFGGVYVSSDYGVNWIQRVAFTAASAVSIRAFDMDSTGRYQFYVSALDKKLYSSSDYGVTWSIKSSLASACASSCGGALAVSGDLKYLLFFPYNNGVLHVSADSGATWSARSNIVSTTGSITALSGDGKYGLGGSSTIFSNILTGNIVITANKLTSWTITGPGGISLNQLEDGVHTVSTFDRKALVGKGQPQTHVYRKMPLGVYTITWKTVDGFQPDSQTFSLVEVDGSIVFDAFYGPSDGDISVVANIPDASWSINGPSRLANARGIAVSGGKLYVLFDSGKVWKFDAGVATEVPGLSNIIQIAGNKDALYAIDAEKNIWAMGLNAYGQLGDGTVITRTEPVRVKGVGGGGVLGGVEQVVAYGNTVLARVGGLVVGWGENTYGQLGDGTIVNRNTPVLVSGLSSGVADIAGADGITYGWAYSYALKTDGTVWFWGGAKVVGCTYPTGASMAVVPCEKQAFRDKDIKKIYSAPSSLFAVSGIDGTVWGYGLNSQGQLGNNTQPGKTAWVPDPVPVASGLKNIISLATVKNSTGGIVVVYSITSDGRLWYWGSDLFLLTYRTLYTFGNSVIPVQVSGFSDSSAVVSGKEAMYILKSDGTVWALGRNEVGQINDGTTEQALTPMRVLGFNDQLLEGVGASGSYTTKPSGEYSITWNPVPGYEPPHGESLVLGGGESITFSGQYVSKCNSEEVWDNANNKCVTGGDVLCGLANNKTFSAKPSANLCTNTSSPSVSQSGNVYSWTCGTNSCTATYSAGGGCNGDDICGAGENALTCAVDGCTNYPQDGVCNNAVDRGCASGVPTGKDAEGKWVCEGVSGGTNSPSCGPVSIEPPASSVCRVNGKCEAGENLLNCPKDCRPKWWQF